MSCFRYALCPFIIFWMIVVNVLLFGWVFAINWTMLQVFQNWFTGHIGRGFFGWGNGFGSLFDGL